VTDIDPHPSLMSAGKVEAYQSGYTVARKYWAEVEMTGRKTTWTKSHWCDVSLNKSCKTYLGPMMPHGGRNWRLISLH
jgi:hypothetical protein